VRLPQSRQGRRIAIALVVLAIVGFYVAVSRLIPHDDLQQVLEDISETLGRWTYLLVGGFAFLETGAFVGLVVPGETVMLLGGAVAGQGAIDLYLLLAIAWFSAWAGDSTSFFIGRRLGRDFVIRHGPRFGISNERFRNVEGYFGRHGGKTILIGRFIGLVRALAPFVAGSSGMRYRAFVPYSILGTGVWATAHILIGYFFSRSIDEAARYAGRGAFLLATAIVIVVGTVIAVRRLRVAENRRRAVAWMEGRRATAWLVVAGRRLQPQARFVWNRLTPGGTFGLEVTTLMATLSVGIFVLVSYTAVIGADPGPTPGDMTALDVAESIQVGWLTDVAKLLTDLGSPAVVLALGIACAVALAVRGHWPELWVLLAAMLIIFVSLDVLKEEVNRPRPVDGLVSTEGSSFPSGHAAYSIFYLWLAATIAIRLRPGMARGSLLVGSGIAVAVLVGLSRVFLEVHYLSDVSGGWALGVSAFAACAAVILVATQLRNSGRRAAATE
jgi:membrane protein DedA with SNARE-associated domain/membrane-associated phospholipid phosphatase